MKEHIPEKPPTMLPTRRVTPIVGRVTEEVRALDQKYFSGVSKFREDADVMRRELERKWAFSLYSMMQPELKPSIKDLMKDEEKIDVLCELFVGEGENTMPVLRWCQGRVTGLVSEDDGSAKNPPVVNVMWEGLAHVQGWEKGSELKQPLKKHLYNKCKEGAWRLDVDIEEVRNVGQEESEGDDDAIESDEVEVEEVIVDEGENDGDSNNESGSDDWTSESEEESDDNEESDEEGEEWLNPQVLRGFISSKTLPETRLPPILS